VRKLFVPLDEEQDDCAWSLATRGVLTEGPLREMVPNIREGFLALCRALGGWESFVERLGVAEDLSECRAPNMEDIPRMTTKKEGLWTRDGRDDDGQYKEVRTLQMKRNNLKLHKGQEKEWSRVRIIK
jgi:hypothetical protein